MINNQLRLQQISMSSICTSLFFMLMHMQDIIQFYLTQKEMCVTKQDVFPPVWEIEQQALQGVLGNKTELIVHVHSESEGMDDNISWINKISLKS